MVIYDPTVSHLLRLYSNRGLVDCTNDLRRLGHQRHQDQIYSWVECRRGRTIVPHYGVPAGDGVTLAARYLSNIRGRSSSRFMHQALLCLAALIVTEPRRPLPLDKGTTIHKVYLLTRHDKAVIPAA